jgi:flagellar basal body rod protein FlgG
MFLSPALSAALDRIGERAADVRRAFTPGAVPLHDDVATSRPGSSFTLDPLAVSVSDGIYFVTRDESGATSYTRDGSFALLDGRLVDGSGKSVCGFQLPGKEIAPLRIDQVDRTLGRVNDPHIDRDGSFVYRRVVVDPRSGRSESQPVVVGRLALARFPAGTRLSTADGIACQAPPGVSPRLGAAGDPDFPAVAPMHREKSRIDLEEGLIRLKEAYAAFDALAAAETAKSHFGKAATDLVK